MQVNLFQTITDVLRDCLFGFSQIFDFCFGEHARHSFRVAVGVECHGELPGYATSGYTHPILRFERGFSRFLESG